MASVGGARGGLGAWLDQVTGAVTSGIRGWAQKLGFGHKIAAPPGVVAPPKTPQALGRSSLEQTPIGLEGPPLFEPTPMEQLQTALEEGPPSATDQEQLAVGGDWHKMASSNVDEMRYLAPDRTLEVVFLNGYHYQYYDVPPQVYFDFITTSSPGRYVWNVLRADGYDYARVGAGVLPTFRTGNVRRTANVVRRPLPEERAALAGELSRLQPGQSIRKPKIPLRQARWSNVRASLKEVRARNKARAGR